MKFFQGMINHIILTFTVYISELNKFICYTERLSLLKRTQKVCLPHPLSPHITVQVQKISATDKYRKCKLLFVWCKVM